MAVMSFLRRVDGLSLTDRVRSSAIQEWFGVEPLHLHIEGRQLRRFRHLTSPGCLLDELFSACPTGRRPRGRPRTHWREPLCAPPDKLEVAKDSELWASLLRPLPLQLGLG